MPRKGIKTSDARKPEGGRPTLQDMVNSSLTPLVVFGAFIAAIAGAITNWQTISERYQNQPILVGTIVALAVALVMWALIGHYGSKKFANRILIVRFAVTLIIGVFYGLLVLWPRMCFLGKACGPSPYIPFRLNFLVKSAHALDKKPLEILGLTIDDSRSSFLIEKDNFGALVQFDLQMISVFHSASCRGIRGKGPIEDALPVWRSLLKDRGRTDLVRKLSDYNGYRDLIQRGGQKGFIEARPTAAELADLMKRKPEWYELLLRWMVECVGVADPVLIWTFRNNQDQPLTLTAVDYDVLDVGHVLSAGHAILEPIDVMPHDLYHQKGIQTRNITPQIILDPGNTVALRIRYRLQATYPGLTWVVKPIFRTAEYVSTDGPVLLIFGANSD